MKRISLALVLILCLPLVGNLKAATDSCDEANRISFICRKMKNLRSQVTVLDAQRDLMQVNYPLLESIGKNIEMGVNELMTRREYNAHLAGIEPVHHLAVELSSEARDHNPNALNTANRFKKQCQNCHGLPTAKVPWDKILMTDWDQVIRHCNTNTSRNHNPYVCKSMYGIRSLVEYFDTALHSGNFDFALAEENSREVNRIAKDLLQIGGPIHEEQGASLKEIVAKSEVMIEYAAKRDPALFQFANQLHQTCVKCHAPSAVILSE